jgi:hypothetical protein
MPKYVQLTASFEIADDENPHIAAELYALALQEAALNSPAATKYWISTLVADEPLPRPDLPQE